MQFPKVIVNFEPLALTNPGKNKKEVALFYLFLKILLKQVRDVLLV